MRMSSVAQWFAVTIFAIGCSSQSSPDAGVDASADAPNNDGAHCVTFPRDSGLCLTLDSCGNEIAVTVDGGETQIDSCGWTCSCMLDDAGGATTECYGTECTCPQQCVP
jgi:hypothetical protein